MGAPRGIVWWTLALAALVACAIGLLPALADEPPAEDDNQELFRPRSIHVECAQDKCQLSREDLHFLVRQNRIFAGAIQALSEGLRACRKVNDERGT